MPPINFANAGFYFAPDAEHVDNVTCYLCHKSLDGWETDDDPIAEHLRHSPNCGAALTASIEAQKDEEYIADPHSESFAHARLTTFGYGLWPHDNISNLSVEMMANAGFHFSPTKEEPDYCLCPFCGVSLANFEPEDDPRIEHHKRAPSCYFFTTEPKKGKRGPRTSTVPRGRRGSRAASVVAEPTVERGRSRDSVDADDEQPPAKKSRGKRTVSVKPKAGGRRGGRKKAVPDYAESLNSISDAEGPPKRGCKRSSSAFDSSEPVILYDGRASTDEDEIVVQPKRQRATRASIARGGAIMAPPKRQRATRASIARQQPIVDYATFTDAEDAIASKPTKGRRAISKILKSAVKSKTYVPVDEDMGDNSLVHDEQLTGEEDTTSLQKPFVRSTKRSTKSRASLVVEQQMKDAPNDVLVPTASKGKKNSRAGSTAPSANVVMKTPLKPFFKDNQDFSMPVSVPRHLNRDVEILDQNSDVPSEMEDSAPEPPVKKGRGRSRKNSVTAEAAKSKRTRVTKKTGTVAKSRSRSVERETPIVINVPDEVPAAESIQSPPREPEPELEPEQAEKPKHGDERQPRQSMASWVSTIPDDSPHHDVPEDHIGDTNIPDSEPEQPSDADSAVKDAKINDSIPGIDEASPVEPPVEVEEEPETEEPVTQSRRQSPRKSPLKTSPTKAPKAQIVGETSMHEQPSPFREHTSPKPELAPAKEMSIDHDTDVSDVFLPESLHGTPAIVTPRQHHSPDRAERQSSEAPRSPLSPVRRQIIIPLVTTPKEKVRTLQSSHTWSPADLDAVFAPPDDEDEEMSGLTAVECEMTVEEWVKWNSANAERRLNDRAERMIAMFEEKGREAMACIEGIPTIS